MKYFCTLLILLLFDFLNAQNYTDIFLSDVSETGKGIISVASSPLSWEWKDAALFAGTAAVFTLLYSNDNEIYNSLEKRRTKTLKSLSDIGAFYGEPLTVVLIAGTFYSYGLFFEDSWFRETAQILTATLIPAGATQTISKITAGRARPYLKLGSKEFKPFRREENYYSFVSGHTLVAVATSLVLAKRINNVIIKGSLYSLALLGSWSRLYSRNHFSSDVFLGATLAYATSAAALSWQKKRKKVKSILSLRLIPLLNGINLQVRF